MRVGQVPLVALLSATGWLWAMNGSGQEADPPSLFADLQASAAQLGAPIAELEAAQAPEPPSTSSYPASSMLAQGDDPDVDKENTPPEQSLKTSFDAFRSANGLELSKTCEYTNDQNSPLTFTLAACPENMIGEVLIYRNLAPVWLSLTGERSFTLGVGASIIMALKVQENRPWGEKIFQVADQNGALRNMLVAFDPLFKAAPKPVWTSALSAKTVSQALILQVYPQGREENRGHGAMDKKGSARWREVRRTEQP